MTILQPAIRWAVIGSPARRSPFLAAHGFPVGVRSAVVGTRDR
jgi:hypothetical protein